VCGGIEGLESPNIPIHMNLTSIWTILFALHPSERLTACQFHDVNFTERLAWK
jgi:hypothetical protein